MQKFGYLIDKSLYNLKPDYPSIPLEKAGVAIYLYSTSLRVFNQINASRPRRSFLERVL